MIHPRLFRDETRLLEEQVRDHNCNSSNSRQVVSLCQLPLKILTLVASFVDTLGQCNHLCQTCSLFREHRVLASSFAVRHDRDIVAVNRVFEQIVYYSGIVTGCTHLHIHTKRAFRFMAAGRELNGDDDDDVESDDEEYALNFGRSGLALTTQSNEEVRDWILSQHLIDSEHNLTGEARRLFFFAQRQYWDLVDGGLVILYRQVGLDALYEYSKTVYVLEGWWCSGAGIATRHLQWRVTFHYSPAQPKIYDGVVDIEVMDNFLSKDILDRVGFVTNEILTSGGAYRVDVKFRTDAAGRARDYVWASYNLFAKGSMWDTGFFFCRRLWHEDSGVIDQSRAFHLALPSYIARYGYYPSVRMVFWDQSNENVDWPGPGELRGEQRQ